MNLQISKCSAQPLKKIKNFQYNQHLILSIVYCSISGYCFIPHNLHVFSVVCNCAELFHSAKSLSVFCDLAFLQLLYNAECVSVFCRMSFYPFGLYCRIRFIILSSFNLFIWFIDFFSVSLFSFVLIVSSTLFSVFFSLMEMFPI